MGIQLGMIALEVRDLQRSIEFYRLLGLEVPDPFPERPVSVYRMDSGVSLVLAEGFAAAADPGWSRPGGDGYQIFMEFFVGDDAAVDAEWEKLTSAGHHGRRAPAKTVGPYAAMGDDPDGNVVLISSDAAADPAAAAP